MIPVQPPNLASPLSPGAISPLKLLTEGDRALLDATILPAKLPNLVLGEQVSARIAEQLSNNQVAVLIKNALFTLTLPPGIQPKGDTLNLRVVSLKPGLSFALQDSEAGADGKESSVQVDLSPASRYLTRLLSAANQDDAGGAGAGGAGGAGKAQTPDAAAQNGKPGLDAAQTALKNAAAGANSNPLLKQSSAQAGEPVALNARDQHPDQVAGSLKQGVENSGLFYESHLKAWDQGKLPLSQLQQEPQAKLGQTLAQDTPEAHASVLPQLGNMVQRQLNALEGQQVPLQGFAWPGQPMQMLIQSEQTDERQGHGESEAHAWTSQLSLNLPIMGGVSARVRLVGKAVQVSFVTEEAAAGGMIQRHSQKLVDGLSAAGLDLATLSIKNEETQSES
ncbi:flagellar hook-length control protein FliK [Paludibacterium purpuratum]|uniref:Flagellar hook-length control protein FliK n=1 Tax=Paludibacterium purpuratum TaxID=1144873 RepID=A0A4R7B3P9_9NEIS|nr:flagellar hook-length control protein FliK [Paludibacterium purpuratum]TDR78448.1 flagellar hook-length control protein FliK [Paludibacterium purpuratum]